MLCVVSLFSREKENEEEDARYENGNDEEAAGIGGGGIEGEGGGKSAWLLHQLFIILMKYQPDCSISEYCHLFLLLWGC